MFAEYSAKMRTLRSAFGRTVEAFVEDYPRLKQAARHELNGMYNEGDYPTNIATKFGVEVVIMPLPDSQDFRASLSDETVAEIKQDIQTELQQTTQLAMREPHEPHHRCQTTTERRPCGARLRSPLLRGLGPADGPRGGNQRPHPDHGHRWSEHLLRQSVRERMLRPRTHRTPGA